jgi:endonuclease/exonuclease/phosphatase family metal-dependent hydrolase
VAITPIGKCVFGERAGVVLSFGDPEQNSYSRVPVVAERVSPTRINLTVPANADCGLHFAVVKDPDAELEDGYQPAEFNVTAPCDSSRRNSFDVVSYNVHMLPFPVDTHNDYRAPLIARHPALQDHDAIVFVEVMTNHRFVLINGMLRNYGYFTDVVDDLSHSYNGGVFILSKWPIEIEYQHVYEHCHGGILTNPPDCLAAKGIKYARINKAGRRYHLLGTHLDAGFDQRDYFARSGQIDEMVAFRFGGRADEPVLWAGDFNIDKRSSLPERQQEYQTLLKALSLTAPPCPECSPVDGTNPKGEWIDYVFFSNAHLPARENSNHVLRPKDGAGGDLSDHYAVLGRFRFAPLGPGIEPKE